LDRPRVTALLAAIRNAHLGAFVRPLLRIVAEGETAVTSSLARWTMLGELFRPDEVRNDCAPHALASHR
jgi:hypothetical protein